MTFEAAVEHERIHLAETTSPREAAEIVARIKLLLQQQLRAIDPELYVEDTNYFNHSAIPDFIVRWSGKREARELYMRPSYLEIIASDDIVRADDKDSIILSLDSRQDLGEATDIQVSPGVIADAAENTERALLSDVRAVGALSSQDNSPAGPLAEVVRQNFVSGGRGWIGPQRARQLLDGSGSPSQSLSQIVEGSFVPSAVLRMRRTAAIVDLVTGDYEPSEEAVATILSGRLSSSEVRILVPWMLDNAERIAAANWRRIGALLALEDLEAVYELLDGRDITPLVTASAARWSARRSYLGLSIPTEEGSANTPAWRFRGKTLGVEIGSHRLSVASSGRKLPSREGISAAPAWASVEQSLRGFRLASVSLRGVARSVRVDAGTSDDIREDVEQVASSLEDSYVVAHVSVRLPTQSFDDEPVSAEIAYAASVVTADGNASLADLTRLSLQTLLYVEPVPVDQVDALVTGDERAG